LPENWRTGTGGWKKRDKGSDMRKNGREHRPLNKSKPRESERNKRGLNEEGNRRREKEFNRSWREGSTRKSKEESELHNKPRRREIESIKRGRGSEKRSKGGQGKTSCLWQKFTLPQSNALDAVGQLKRMMAAHT